MTAHFFFCGFQFVFRLRQTRLVNTGIFGARLPGLFVNDHRDNTAMSTAFAGDCRLKETVLSAHGSRGLQASIIPDHSRTSRD
jgi:hypothetical protein